MKYYQKPVFEISEVRGSISVMVTREGSNQSWSMGLNFESKKLAEDFKKLVKDCCKNNSDKVSA